MLFFRKKEIGSFVDIGLTADVHSHILPGIDDGSANLQESVSILTELHRLGVRKAILTPHVSRSLFPNIASDLRERFANFTSSLPEELQAMELHLASEYMVDEFFRNLDDRLLWPDGQHILIEMSYYERSREIRDTVFNLRMDGLQPVLAHPERYVFYQQQFDRKKGVRELEELFDMGAEMQLNVMSLTGAYGQRSVNIVEWLLDHDMYRFIGTDVHSRGQIDRFNGFRLTAGRMDKVRQLARNNETLFA